MALKEIIHYNLWKSHKRLFLINTNIQMKDFVLKLTDFLEIYLKTKDYVPSHHCTLMKQIICHELDQTKYRRHKTRKGTMYMYFFRARKARGNLYKIGIANNSLLKRIESLNQEFENLNYRLILIGYVKIKSQETESKLKKELRHYLANPQEREKRNGIESTESYCVSDAVYDIIRTCFQRHSNYFWSKEYKISHDRESYYDKHLGENTIYMEIDK